LAIVWVGVGPHASRQWTGDPHFAHGPTRVLELDLGDIAQEVVGIGGALGGVDSVLARHVVGVTLDDVAIGQVVQGRDALLAVASHPESLVVAASDQDQRIDLVRMNVFLSRTIGPGTRVEFPNRVWPRTDLR
jgi:hypothetical protein